MRKIIRINRLRDYYHEMIFGFVGLDILSGEIKYYSYYDENDYYTPNVPHEFFMDNPPKIVRWHLEHCHYNRPDYADNLPYELCSKTKSIIEKHEEYNKLNNLPTEFLDFNKSYLAIKYDTGFRLHGPCFLAQYTPVENIIHLTVAKREWETLSKEKKQKHINSLIHEIGHMKASFFLVDANNKLRVKTGFYETTNNLKTQVLPNGDICYQILDDNNDDIHGLILEELINDLDCSEAFPEFRGKYPDFGKTLNNLCDGALKSIRYTTGIDGFYEIMSNLNSSEDLAKELLVKIYHTTRYRDELSYLEALRIIGIYGKEKRLKLQKRV